MYENPKQIEPTFDAKGIETIRRDSCPVVAKMLERSIRVLFSTHDLSLVSSYLFSLTRYVESSSNIPSLKHLSCI